MSRRAQEAYRELEAVATATPVPEVAEVLRLGAPLRLVPDNRAQLEAAAERIRAAGQRFASGTDGTRLAALDPLIRGAVAAAPTPPVTEPGAEPDSESASTAAPTALGAPAPAAAARPELPGRVLSRPAWFPAPGQHTIVGATQCTSCHGEAEDWWLGDKHQRTGRRLVGEDPRARQIAELYGIGASAMARGDQICMSCHGTVDERTRAVREEGVSCESCHGAASAYLEPHENGGNPQQGMTALKQPAARAQNCARCHHITDERLLATGHPSGDGYNLGRASEQIVHWPGRRPARGRERRGEGGYPAVTGAALQSALASVTGTVVALSRPAAAAPAPRADGAPAAGRTLSARRSLRTSGGGSAIAPAHPATLTPRADGAPLEAEIQPLSPTDELTAEELLLLVKRRLEVLYAAIGRGN
jgi:hypothetical protein